MSVQDRVTAIRQQFGVKRLEELTADDLRRHPVWKGCEVNVLDSFHWTAAEDFTDDYAPWTGDLPVDTANGRDVLVRVEVTLADGTSLLGRVWLQPRGKALLAGQGMPVLYLPSGEMYCVPAYHFNYDDEKARTHCFVSPGEQQRVCDALGREPHAVFPIRVSVAEGLTTGQVVNRIEGMVDLHDVYVAKPDEAMGETAAWIPFHAEQLGPMMYRLMGPSPVGTALPFQPGDVVRCEVRIREGWRLLVAVERA